MSNTKEINAVDQTIVSIMVNENNNILQTDIGSSYLMCLEFIF